MWMNNTVLLKKSNKHLSPSFGFENFDTQCVGIFQSLKNYKHFEFPGSPYVNIGYFIIK
jgi:hypothetical protein